MFTGICRYFLKVYLEGDSSFLIIFPLLAGLLSGIIVAKKVHLFLGIALGFLIPPALFIFLIFFIEFNNNIIAEKYFPLNAAIKNTCYLDPKRINCPTTLKEIIHIEPERFSQMLMGKRVDYKYYPSTNEYTLAIWDNWFRGVIFDPRLAKQGSYAYDFADIGNNCSQIPAAYVFSRDEESVQKYLNAIWPTLNLKRYVSSY